MPIPFVRPVRWPPGSPLQVFAVEDTAIQLAWGHLPAGPVTAAVTAEGGGARAAVDHAGGPGCLDLTGLTPNRFFDVDVTWAGGHQRLAARTLPSPPGELLCRIATVSDLHLGSRNWGLLKLMRDRSGHAVPFPLRCAQAALAEATAWGAEHLIVKGDGAHHQHPDHYAQLGQLLDDHPALPVTLIPGNHEVDELTDHQLPPKVGARGVPYVTGTACEDLPGIRLVVADTTIEGQGRGTISRVADEVVELAALAGGPFLLAVHHHLHERRYPTYYPLGIPAPASVRFLDSLVGANPAGLVTSGHVHRCRSRRHGPLAVTEVAGTRDWPGVWAGYAVHEGGIRQVVRRIADPHALAWTEYSRRALNGQWEHWAPGPLGQRCFTHRFAPRPASRPVSRR